MQKYIFVYILMFGILSSIIWECICKNIHKKIGGGGISKDAFVFLCRSLFCNIGS